MSLSEHNVTMKPLKPTEHPAFAFMLAAAQEAKLTSFTTDLTKHDANYLATSLGCLKQTFVWAVGTAGTFFSWTKQGERSQSAGKKLTETILEMFPNMYAWDGTRLTRVSPEAFTMLMDGKVPE